MPECRDASDFRRASGGLATVFERKLIGALPACTNGMSFQAQSLHGQRLRKLLVKA